MIPTTHSTRFDGATRAGKWVLESAPVYLTHGYRLEYGTRGRNPGPLSGLVPVGVGSVRAA